jgi:VWFA-related protein
LLYDRSGPLVTHILRVSFSRAVAIAWLTTAGALPQTQPPPGGAQTPSASATNAAPPQTAAPIDKNAPEMTTKEAPAIFKTRVDLVSVPVVVRDSKGHVVSNLTKENFQVFDKGKPQEIIRFSLEKTGDLAAKAAKTVDANPTEGAAAARVDIPERFIAYLFDDIHGSLEELARSRDAVSQQLGKQAKTDRAAIYTTSGQNQVDFTDEIDKLQAALLLLRNRSITGNGGMATCPEISYYMADMIINKNDPTATSYATQEAWSCTDQPPNAHGSAAAAAVVQSVARQVLSAGEHDTHLTLTVLKDVVRRMGAMPGQRIVILISPGFFSAEEFHQEKSDIMDQAIRSSVIVNSLDARGLWNDRRLDASHPSGAANQGFLMLKQDYDRLSAQAQGDVLGEMAYGTGGSLYANNNDLSEGMRQLANTPEAHYVLGFGPQNLKLDGSFHSLKVVVKTVPPVSLSLQARRGYYAPRKASDPEETARGEMEEALFSIDELRELPVEIHIQFFKLSDREATIAVVCRLDPRQMQFKKVDGRNTNMLTILSGLFDHNGNFISAMQKTVDIKMKDETMAKLMTAGTLAFKTNFSAPPGSYMIRLIVRDAEGQLMSALNGAAAIQ